MAVDFPTDLILDVARAADPAKAQNVAARLSGAASGSEPAAVLADAAKVGRHLSRVHQNQKPEEAAKQFEALLVANMVKDMIGETGASFYGEGFAGDVWKSMMSEQIANQVVEASDFGIADTLVKHFVHDGEKIAAVSGIHDAKSTPLENREIDAARSGTNEISRDFIRKMMQIDGTDDRG